MRDDLLVGSPRPAANGDLSRMSFLEKNFVFRVFTTCFLGVHVPLIAFVVFQASRAHAIDWPALAVLTAATLVGTIVTLYAMRKELRPVLEVTSSLSRFAETGTMSMVSVTTRDEIAELAQSATWTMKRVKSLLEELGHQSRTDPLTKLLNRRGFLEEVTHDSQGAVALLDIDHFKSINDTHGHLKGDDILQIFARYMDSFRAGWIAGRWGGEEFVIFAKDADAKQLAAEIDRLRGDICQLPLLPDRQVNFSAGVVDFFGKIDASLNACDELLYEAKRTGRAKTLVGSCSAKAAGV